MTYSPDLACVIKTDMSQCIGYSTTQRKWVAADTKSFPGEVVWREVDPFDLRHVVPPLDRLYFPTSEGWNQVDVCKLVQLLAIHGHSGPVATSSAHRSLWDQLSQDPGGTDALPRGVRALCAYEVGSTTMYLTDFTHEWIQHVDSQWDIPNQCPAPDTLGWHLFDDGSWKTADVFMTIEHLANRVPPAVWEARQPAVLPD